jgi:hypothetical protein
MLMCLLDSRGVGASSKPKSKKDYSTQIMAEDVRCVMVLPWLVLLVKSAGIGFALVETQGNRNNIVCVIQQSPYTEWC